MKLLHSIRFRFALSFCLFVFALCAVTSIIAMYQTSKTVSRFFIEQGVFMTEEAASLIDGDAFERLLSTMDAEDPFYEKTRSELLIIKNYSTAKYLYTMGPVNGDISLFIIDGSVPPGDEEFSALGDESDVSGYDPAFMKCWETRRTEYSAMTYQEDWGWLISIYTPIINSAGEMVGITGCDFEAEDLRNSLWQEGKRQIFTGLGFLALGILLLMVLLRIIFNPLKNMSSILREISSGEGDLTKQIQLRREDEIGELAKYFNLTLEKIRRLVITIKDKSSVLSGVGNELASSMEQTAAAINQITANTRNIKSKVMHQAAGITETNATMEQVTVNIDKLNGHVEQQTDSVSRSSAAIEEMLANIQSVTQTLIRNTKNVTELIEASETGRSGLEKVSRDIREIAKQSEGILEINAVMQNIASQTNLLSMNAAIEAAHAGEAGRGFAVVAGEIRKLAEDSGKQSKTISQVLRTIKESIDLITVSANTVLETFSAIDERIRIVSDQEEHIRNAMEEQGQGSQQILEAVGALNELTRLVKQGSGEMLEGSREVIQESSSLDSATREIINSVNEMALSADQINGAVSRINGISASNRKNTNDLAVEVSKFKVQ
ncbi:MAG: methyl-accepting chemotaxis protein [Spirochaetaceae bacterium]|jgi:methyl-accepting chemotaxis protein|nr:methyl-accepting chemotaxis protein [Spirochaetaceae bacterium]